jgi:hypothetical protein
VRCVCVWVGGDIWFRNFSVSYGLVFPCTGYESGHFGSKHFKETLARDSNIPNSSYPLGESQIMKTMFALRHHCLRRNSCSGSGTCSNIYRLRFERCFLLS